MSASGSRLTGLRPSSNNTTGRFFRGRLEGDIACKLEGVPTLGDHMMGCASTELEASVCSDATEAGFGFASEVASVVTTALFS